MESDVRGVILSLVCSNVPIKFTFADGVITTCNFCLSSINKKQCCRLYRYKVEHMHFRSFVTTRHDNGVVSALKHLGVATIFLHVDILPNSPSVDVVNCDGVIVILQEPPPKHAFKTI